MTQVCGGAGVRLAGDSPRANEVLGSLRAVVLLAGSLRSNPLKLATGRNLLDLPVTPRESVLDLWRLELAELAAGLGPAPLPVRVMVEKKAAQPQLPASGDEALALSIEEDPGDYRGTGGLLSDLAAEYDDDAYLLVAGGAQILLRHMVQDVRQLAEVGADAALLCSLDGEPTGMMLIRCGALRGIKRIGFVDLKEQALPQIARDHEVRVVRTASPLGAPIRTLKSYIDGLRAYVRQGRGQALVDCWENQQWQPTFALVEDGAKVHDSAVLHDAVVLRGATIGAGAVVVRSLVGQGAVIEQRQVVDEVVGLSGSGRPPYLGLRSVRSLFSF